MYVCAIIFLGKGFTKPQAFFNILNENASLIVLSCGMSLVMITGGIDISVGQVTSLVCMACAVYLDKDHGLQTIESVASIALGPVASLLELGVNKLILDPWRSDIDEYYTQEEHTHFSKYGYYQQTMENRYDNRFFIPNANMKTAVDIIYNEGMVIDNVESQNLPVPIFVVTLRGVNESNFNIDFGTQYKVVSTLSQNK